MSRNDWAKCAFSVFLCLLAACGREATASGFAANLTYEVIAEAGGQNETNDLFIYGSPVPLLVDSTVVAYVDQAVGGALAVVDMLRGTGWSLHSPVGSDGPGELNGRVPLVSTSGDTIKTFRGDGRLAARLVDGTLIYDSVIPRTFRPGMMALTFGLAGNKRIAEYHVEGDTIRLGILLESVSEPPLMIELGTAPLNADGGFTSPFAIRARRDLVVYLNGYTVTTLDIQGRLIAQRQIPWRTFNAVIDASGRVWIQVFGDASGGYNLMQFTRELELVGQAIVPRFRDAFGDYVLSTRLDSLNVEVLVLSRLK